MKIEEKGELVIIDDFAIEGFIVKNDFILNVKVV